MPERALTFDRIIVFNDKEKQRSEILARGLKPVFMKGEEFLTSEQSASLRTTIREMEKDTQTHGKAREQFINFNAKSEKLLAQILEKIGVADETGSDEGVTGRLSNVENGLFELTKGDTFLGTVVSYKPYMKACYVKCDMFSEQISLVFAQMTERYTNPASVFAEGNAVVLKVYDIDFKNKRITFSVTPKGGK